MNINWIKNLFTSRAPLEKTADFVIIENLLSLPKADIPTPNKRHVYLKGKPVPVRNKGFDFKLITPLIPATALALLLIAVFNPTQKTTEKVTQKTRLNPHHIDDTREIVTSTKISTEAKVEALASLTDKTTTLLNSLKVSSDKETISQIKEIQNKPLDFLSTASQNEQLKGEVEKNVEALNNLITVASKLEPDIASKDFTISAKGTVTAIEAAAITLGSEKFTLTGSTTIKVNKKQIETGQIETGDTAIIEYTVKEGKKISIEIVIKPLKPIHNNPSQIQTKSDIIDVEEKIDTSESKGNFIVEDPKPECNMESSCVK